jgi:hypothetical protein
MGFCHTVFNAKQSRKADTRRTAMFKAIWLWLTHYQVCVVWEELNALHYAKTYAEALEWSAQYPQQNTLVMIGKRNKLLAARGQ